MEQQPVFKRRHFGTPCVIYTDHDQLYCSRRGLAIFAIRIIKFIGFFG